MIYPRLINRQLAKDAPYTWFQYDRAKQHARYRLADFSEQAGQLEAQIDALGIALRSGEPVESWLDTRDWGVCFVLALLGKRYNQTDLFDHALDTLTEDEETHPREIADACLWDQTSIEELGFWIQRLSEHSSPVARQAAITVISTIDHEFTPEVMHGYLTDENQLVRIRLLDWFGENDHKEQLAFVQQHYDYAEPDIRFAAARAGALLGDKQSISALTPFSLANNLHMLEAITLLFIQTMETNQKSRWLESLWARDDAPTRAKLFAVAIAGLPEAVTKLFPAMVEDDTCRAAGEAFTLLTGADLEDQDLDASESSNCIPCNNNEATLSQRRKIDPFISDWEDDLPYPCPDAVTDWWHHQQGHFVPGETYLAGLTTSKENLKSVLTQGNQRQRGLAALYLRVRHGEPWRETGWPVWLQENF
jgi:uncharacterized protein (TIGR02270 family)